MNESEIKFMREAEISSLGLDNEVIDVKILKDYTDPEKKEAEYYLLIEEFVNKEGKRVTVERYYDTNGKVIGGNNKSDNYDCIILNGENINNEELRNRLEYLRKQLEKVEKLKDTNGMKDKYELKEMLEAIEAETGENIEELSIIDIEMLEEAERELNGYLKTIGEEQENKTSESVKKQENENSEKLNITDKQEQLMEKDFESSAIMSGNTYINEYDTLNSALGVSDEGYTKIAVVRSSELKDNNTMNDYSFVGIRADGTAQKIDSSVIEAEMEDIGRNYNELDPHGKLDQDEGNIETFKIKGTRYGFGLENEAGELEVKLTAEGKGRHGNEVVSVPVQTNGYALEPNERDVVLLNNRHPADVDKGLDELHLHDEDDEEITKTVEDLDGNPDTQSHNDWDELIESLDDEAKDMFSNNELKEMAEKYWANGDSEDEIKNKIEKDAYNLDRENKR